ncbi:MAG: glycosyltransferase [Leptolyngbyaceae cyanobacterium]
MRTLYFLVPGTTRKFYCGGLFAELKTLELARHFCRAEVVTYRQREPHTLFLNDLLQQPSYRNDLFVVSWGFDVPKLAARLKGYNVIYHAHSAAYGFRLPASIPIIAVSRYTMGYWGQQSPNSLIYYLPNQISDGFCDRQLDRDIDVLVQVRKSSEYLIQDLVPALQNCCQVYLLDAFVEDLSVLFNRSRVYLYDSAEYWAMQRVTEGFGLPPLEALACGCQVFSSVNSALSDFLDPGVNIQKIAAYSKDYDVQRILNTLKHPTLPPISQEWLAEYRTEAILKRMALILREINEFFDRKPYFESKIPDLTALRLMRLSFKQVLGKVQKKLSRA